MAEKTFIVWMPDDGCEFEDGDEVMSYDAEEAVRYWAQHHDQDGDYTIVKGSEAQVCVANQDGSDVQKFVVTGEMVAQYYVRPDKEASNASR